MKIYKMTATFGKLEQETLTLEPGLNIVEAPNEWGKTTWCAFLIAMLYGLDTRAKTTRTALADKEKYAPWSGSPMAGRIDLSWNGRDITIERSTRGRTPMGMFRAYETASGLAVPELTAANCGQMLLGVEQSVYRRTGFVRQSDMPVTQDDALRRRLNDLVTTGDESGDSGRLEAELKDLKNKCRYNRSGLLPQAEAKRQALEETMEELEALQNLSRKLKERLGEVKSWRQTLENHAQALRYADAEADAGRVAEARDLYDRAEATVTALERRCAGQPDRETIAERLLDIQNYHQLVEAYRKEASAREEAPVKPVVPKVFRDMTPEQAAQMVAWDQMQYQKLRQQKSWLVFLLVGAVLMIWGLLSLMARKGLGLVPSLSGLAVLAMGLYDRSGKNRERLRLEEKYGSADLQLWDQLLSHHRDEQLAYEHALMEYGIICKNLEKHRGQLQKQRIALFGDQMPETALAQLQQMHRNWEEYEMACREFRQAQKHLKTLQEMTRNVVKKPSMEDALAYSWSQTQTLLEEAQAEQQRLHNRLGQYQGRMDALGDPQSLQRQLQTVTDRINQLEEVYGAVSLALDTLAQTRQELQRKFAPRISGRARELLEQMTEGRYRRLTLCEDLSLLAGAQQEEILREVLWRSDGTVDQIYLALRLAVAEELMPHAPLVLDDVFVRFDDTRLKAALDILTREAEKKQVILFTCQHREKELLG